jgi:crotonobetainyl-CoA:carnitine CoA-transferase CaiB-like acyl-CoA transferase
VERNGGASRQTVAVSALEACLWSNWKSYAEQVYLGTTPTRLGVNSEWHVLACADGFATFIYLEKDWPAVVRMVGQPRLGAPPLDTRAGRRAHMADVLATVAPWYAARTRAEIFQLAKAAGLPIAPVMGVPELADDAQYRALGFLVPPLAGDLGGSARVPALPVSWNGTRFVPRASAAIDVSEPPR